MTGFHGAQSAHNMRALDRLGTPDHVYPDWEMAMIFYAALHLVDSYCIGNGLEKAKNHRRRCRIVEEEMSQIHQEYEQLFDLSMQARYTKGHTMTPRDLDLAGRLYGKLAASLSRN